VLLLELSEELAALADDQEVQSRHNRLERERPIGAFEAKDFRARQEANSA
jgi:hypothetical protein